MKVDRSQVPVAGGHADRLSILFLMLILVLTSLAAVSVTRLPKALAGPTAEPKKFAVLAAVDDYARFPGPLKYCLEDLQDMRDVLVNNCGFLPANVFELKDATATTANLRDTLLTKLAPQVGPNDTVIIFFSGHGWPNLFGWGEGLYMSDGIIFDWQLKALLSKVHAGKLAVFLDSCFSGGFGGVARGIQGSSSLCGLSAGEGLAQKLSGTGRVVLTACRAWELSDEYPDLQNGLFTYNLCQALRSSAADADGDKRIDTSEAFAYLYPRVLQYSLDAHKADFLRPIQHPQIYNGIPGGLELGNL
jgi:uncharacterized caspase-like protein